MKVPAYQTYRSSMQLGTRKVGEAWHVQYKTDEEEESIASFWVGDRQSAMMARIRADVLAAELNRKDTP